MIYTALLLLLFCLGFLLLLLFCLYWLYSKYAVFPLFPDSTALKMKKCLMENFIFCAVFYWAILLQSHRKIAKTFFFFQTFLHHFLSNTLNVSCVFSFLSFTFMWIKVSRKSRPSKYSVSWKVFKLTARNSNAMEIKPTGNTCFW